MPDGALYLLVVSAFSFVGFFLLCLRFRRANQANRNIGLHHVQVIPSGVPSQTSGVEEELVNSLPMIVFMSQDDSSNLVSECAVCLARFEDSDLLHLLPKCKHTFHVQCIDKWLEDHSSCPICRKNVDAQDFSSFRWLYSSWNSGNMADSTQITSGNSVHQGDNSRQVSLRLSSEPEGLSVGSMCAICLDRFEDSELLLLPKCGHRFHVSCTYNWFESHAVCPVCRQHMDPHELSSVTVIKRETLNSVSNVGQSTNQNPFGQKDNPGQAQ